jgi:tetratricopeptide (TPR) repeat protein
LFSKTVSENADETALVKAAQDFAGGADEMAVHRQLYAASKLLNRKVALPQVIEMTQAATNDLEKSLNAPSPTAAVLAEELYEPRRLAQTRGTLLNVSDVPRETLRQIMRGRVEEIAGWTLFQQDKPEEAIVRLRRAVGVLPPNSAWWRSSYWKLGAALEASGKPKDALEAYIRSYKSDAPNETRRVIIEGLYQRINGSLDGLEEKLSNTSASAPSSALALRQNNRIRQPATSPLPTPTPAAFRNPLPNVIAAIVQPTPQATPSATPEAAPSPEITASPTPEVVAEATPQPVISPTPEAASETKPEEKTVEKIEEKPEQPIAPQTEQPQETVPEPSPTPEVKTQTPAEVITTPTPELKQEPTVEPTPEEVKPVESTVKTETKTEENTPPTVEPTPEIKSETAAKSESSPQTLAVTEVKPPDETRDETKEVRPDTAEAPALTAIKKTEPQVSEEESALNRPRVVIRNINESAANSEPKTAETNAAPSQCTMQVNQKQLSILRNGGMMSLLVSFSNPADAEKVTVKADSADISVALVPDEDKTNNRRVFQITSVNEFTKTYTLFVESPCGKEEVKVRVR